jgi:hypothetical protein
MPSWFAACSTPTPRPGSAGSAPRPSPTPATRPVTSRTRSPGTPPRRHRAHRDNAGHRQRRPSVAVPGHNPRHRHQHGVRVHHPRQANRPPSPAPAPHPNSTLRPRPARTTSAPTRTGPSRLCPDSREPIAVLADVLERDGSEPPASETRRRSLSNADHLAILNAQWTTETHNCVAVPGLGGGDSTVEICLRSSIANDHVRWILERERRFGWRSECRCRSSPRRCAVTRAGRSGPAGWRGPCGCSPSTSRRPG